MQAATTKSPQPSEVAAAKAPRSKKKPAPGPRTDKATQRTTARKATAAQTTQPTEQDAPKLRSQVEVRACYKKLVATHPDAHCELDHNSPFELIVATALSAQSTDVQVNKVTPALFKSFPTPERLSKASQEQVESKINSLGMFRQKAKNLIGLARALVRDHQGQVPADLDELVKLPGVGRKTANVVLGVAFNAPVGVVVDTHVQRISQRLGWTEHSDVIKIEQDLMRLLPKSEWDRISHTLIFHGRRVCTARKPACSTCSVNKQCLHAFSAEEVGRKPKRTRA